MNKYYREIKGTSKNPKVSNVLKRMEDEDPFLCPKCQKHGYCIEKFYKNSVTNELIPIRDQSPSMSIASIDYTNKPITKNDISNIVNIRTEIKEASTRFGKKLQNAHDLFHQDEFEQASYLYQDIIETRSDITEAWRGIVACFYFLGKFDEAASIAMNPKLGFDTLFINRFVKACEQNANSENDSINSKVEENSKLLNLINN